MLKTALVAMTIVGCDCDARLCEFVSESPAQWTSVAACEEAVKAEVLRAPGVAYPLVTGICRAAPAAEDAAPAVDLASLKQEDGRSLYDMVLDGGGYVLDKTAGGFSLVKAGAAWTVERIAPTAIAWVPAAN